MSKIEKTAKCDIKNESKLNLLTTNLKKEVEENTCLNLESDFYKNYIQAYHRKLAEFEKDISDGDKKIHKQLKELEKVKKMGNGFNYCSKIEELSKNKDLQNKTGLSDDEWLGLKTKYNNYGHIKDTIKKKSDYLMPISEFTKSHPWQVIARYCDIHDVFLAMEPKEVRPLLWIKDFKMNDGTMFYDKKLGEGTVGEFVTKVQNNIKYCIKAHERYAELYHYENKKEYLEILKNNIAIFTTEQDKEFQKFHINEIFKVTKSKNDYLDFTSFLNKLIDENSDRDKIDEYYKETSDRYTQQEVEENKKIFQEMTNSLYAQLNKSFNDNLEFSPEKLNEKKENR